MQAYNEILFGCYYYTFVAWIVGCIYILVNKPVPETMSNSSETLLKLKFSEQ